MNLINNFGIATEYWLAGYSVLYTVWVNIDLDHNLLMIKQQAFTYINYNH